MNAIEQLKSVLCDHAGKCSIIGSDEDRAIVDRALQALAAPVQPVSQAIIHAITEYGDARADQDANNAPTTSHERLADCIRLIRDALPPPAQPAPVQPVPVFELQKSGWEIICDLDWIQTLPFGTKLYTTPPAAAVQEGRDWSLLEATQESLREHITEIKRLKAAQPAVPDALNPKDENPAYAAGWNDCRAEMLKGMK